MPIPNEYQRATDHLNDFLMDARDYAGLGSTHQAYTMTQGVFVTFRRRLDPLDAIKFAVILPALLRAIFVSDWDPTVPKRSFVDRDEMTREVQALRAEHNFAPDSAISDVARALRKHVDIQTLDRVLADFPDGAAEFWGRC